MNPTERTQVCRHAERGVYDVGQIYPILNEGYICHIGFVGDGQSFVIPMAYGCSGNHIYIHGPAASRAVCSVAEGINTCARVTGRRLCAARSAFRHSINYRSVVIFEPARLITDRVEKMEGLRCLTNHLVPGRWEGIRPPNKTEMIKTSLPSLLLNEVSAKVRSGPPLDLGNDYPIRVWAGVVPLRAQAQEPIADPHVLPGILVMDKGRFDRAYGFASRPTLLADIRLP